MLSPIAVRLLAAAAVEAATCSVVSVPNGPLSPAVN
jgi:hypothetical protein